MSKEIESQEKSEKVISFYEGERLRNLINWYKRNSYNFKVRVTGYTATITNYSLNEKMFFVKSKNKNNFALLSKIKKDIDNSGIYIDKIHNNKINYFKMNNLKEINLREVHNVDINSAYPSGLKKLGFITEATFEALMSADKSDRLKAIGQIATRSTEYNFTLGKMEGRPVIIENEFYRAVWFALCFDVGDVIDKARKSIDSFLFYWFDGIYFTDVKETQKVIDILESSGYECKHEKLTDFKVLQDDRNFYVSYLKENEEKEFILPKSEKVEYS